MRPPKIANIPKALSDMISKYVTIGMSSLHNLDTFDVHCTLLLFHRCWDEEREYRPSMNELRVKLTKLCKVCVTSVSACAHCVQL